MAKKLVNFLLFSSVYIAGVAVMMVYQTNQLLELDYNRHDYLLFVFFSTICSYNFHWYLTSAAHSDNERISWTNRHRKFQLFLSIAGSICAAWFALSFLHQWPWMGLSVVLTFLYSAPKLPGRIFSGLRKIAVGKTIFLSFVWTYVTTVLPIVLGGNGFGMEQLWFCLSRFFLIYAICIIFDLRDREQDIRDGIRSMITYFSEKGVEKLFVASVILFFVTSLPLYHYFRSPILLAALLVPGVVTWALFRTARNNYSDYLYYGVLDGLMMLSSLLTALISF